MISSLSTIPQISLKMFFFFFQCKHSLDLVIKVEIGHLNSSFAIWDVLLMNYICHLCSPALPNNQFECIWSSGSWISSLQFSSNVMVVLLWVGGFFSHCFFLFGKQCVRVRAHMADSCGNREDEPRQFLNWSFGYWNKNIFLFYFAILYKPSSSQSQNTFSFIDQKQFLTIV